MIRISNTYEIVTPESAENGEAAEQGFVFEDVGYTFRELVRLMEEFPNLFSSLPYTIGTWLSSEPDPDYQTGAEETESIHYSHVNKPRSAKYWAKALRYTHGRK